MINKIRDVEVYAEAIRARRVDVVVVYKVDRLTRSLADFVMLVELFEAHGVSFVAVSAVQHDDLDEPSYPQ